MEKLQIAKIRIYPHIYTLPSFYSRSRIYGSGSNKNETNTIQETRELTEQEQKIVNAGGFIATIIITVLLIVLIIKVLKEA